jgi:hypothetical protein
MTVRIRQPGLNRKERTAGTEQNSQDRTARTGQPECTGQPELDEHN